MGHVAEGLVEADAFRFVASKAHFGGKRSIPWGPATVHDFLHAKLVVCDDWAFAGSYNHSRAGEENAENVLAIDGKACADRVAQAIGEFAARYAHARRRPLVAAGCLSHASTTTARGRVVPAARGAPRERGRGA